MDKSIPKPSIGLVEPVTRRNIEIPLPFRATEIRVDEIQGEELYKRGIKTLIVEGNSSELKTALLGLRATASDITVMALADGLDREDTIFYRNYVDSLFSWPKDKDRFFAALSQETSEVHERHLAGIWNATIRNIIAIGTLITIWWIAVALLKPAPYFFPSPEKVAAAFASNIPSFVSHLLITASEAILGFLAGNGLGIIIAIVLHRYVRLRAFTLPVLISFQAIPIVALAPLLVVWLGTGLLSKVTMAAIICFFPMVVNTLNAFSNVDRDYVELFDFYRAEYPARLRMLLLPASFPTMVAALRISAGLAVVGAIVAELTGADEGLGYLLLNASYRLETDILFVAMLLSGLLGIGFFHMPTLLRFVVPRSWGTASL
uniref:ABC-type nitrate/sulfonate/bicarbonate transport system, permease component n=1 Tax=Candidatus Kentrum sp. DK TaxID=2126562 RepID=A0A450SR71_9GAMM|nr:MAG: ABC-type nitrate/sulfonate/bicarbonate transport system, permease component [Candidatus Kentron sp. DK]